MNPNTTLGARSFRPEFRHRAPGYRTPSPPSDQIEPLSPLVVSDQPRELFQSSFNRKRKYNDNIKSFQAPRSRQFGHDPGFGDSQHLNGQPMGPPPINTDTKPCHRPSPSALDVLSTLATSPTLGHDQYDPQYTPRLPGASFMPSGSPAGLHRSSKRSRSELTGFRAETIADSRPATSYVPSSAPRQVAPVVSNHHARHSDLPPQPNLSTTHQGRIEVDRPLEQDAELLLSFSRAINERPSHPTPRNPLPLEHPYQSRPSDFRLAHQVNPNLSFQFPARQSQNSSLMQCDAKPTPGGLEHGIADAKPEPSEEHSTQLISQPLTDASHIHPKSREHRGWPKGKPRGPRNEAADKRRNKTNNRKADGPKDRGPGGPRQRKPRSKTNRGETTNEDVFDVSTVKTARRRKSDAETITLAHLEHEISGLSRSSSAPPVLNCITCGSTQTKQKAKGVKQEPKYQFNEVCKACENTRHPQNGVHEFWISCNGCKGWFHTICAGFDSEKKVKEVDKFYCKPCVLQHGPTTYVRKSSRAHASVDYAGLHEGKLRMAVDVPEHHYIKPIKEGSIEFQQETFPRMRPELVTYEHFSRCGGMAEPILIPAGLNPRPFPRRESKLANGVKDPSAPEVPENVDFYEDCSYDCVGDEGQDNLDMVMPQDLSVRQVAELYGPEEKVEVIDVKLQEGEDRRWNMRQWADYYEADGEKPVRNVISLEVSQSKLGRLIKRPKIVRDLDLQDSVWPQEETAKGIYPKVQFYCLMSVADCFTDFHIDFGGSSVYYHILKGRKTFFFIPPRPKNLKKYEEWCLSPDQNSTFLGNETKECYRVDLYPGDTMLIPSGWIHAVWTPENSLVIGGNFLTRMHYGMQIQINDIEKNTGVARKFRYPYFQRILWLAAVQYLEQDPVPATVVERLAEGNAFERKTPVYDDFDAEESSKSDDPEQFNARFYSQGELEGLHDLIRYLHRTVMISLGKMPGVQKSTQDAVLKSMPKGCGNHVELLQTFALWTAWKRGNENIPPWAYPDTGIAEFASNSLDKRPSAAAQRKLERQAAHEAFKIAGDHRSLRQVGKDESSTPEKSVEEKTGFETSPFEVDAAVSSNGPRRACEPCRKRRIRCAHSGSIGKPDPAPLRSERFGILRNNENAQSIPEMADRSTFSPEVSEKYPSTASHQESTSSPNEQRPSFVGVVIDSPPKPSQAHQPKQSLPTPPILTQVQPAEAFVGLNDKATSPPTSQQTSTPSRRVKARACSECKKTKRRCIHDKNGQVDPVKASEAPVPRGSNPAKRPRLESRFPSDSLKMAETDVSNGPRTHTAHSHVDSGEPLETRAGDGHLVTDPMPSTARVNPAAVQPNEPSVNAVSLVKTEPTVSHVGDLNGLGIHIGGGFVRSTNAGETSEPNQCKEQQTSRANDSSFNCKGIVNATKAIPDTPLDKAPDDGVNDTGEIVPGEEYPETLQTLPPAPQPYPYPANVPTAPAEQSSSAQPAVPTSHVALAQRQPSPHLANPSQSHVNPPQSQNRQQNDSRSRTSSLHLPTNSSDSVVNDDPSRSPPTSPLTEVDEIPSCPHKSSSTQADAARAQVQQASRHTPRARKPVERYTDDTNTATPRPHTASGTRPASRSPTTARSKSREAFAKPNGVPVARPTSSTGSSKKRSASRSLSREMSHGVGSPGSFAGSPGSVKKPRRLSTPEQEQEESLRLARMLSAGEYGLRRR